MRDHIEIIECLRYSILTEERGRIDYLVNNYGAKLEANWRVDQTVEPMGIRDAVQNTPGDTVAQKLIGYIASFDPSPNGQYTQWMILRYLKNALRLQDLPAAKEYLTLFATMKAKKQLPAGQADINAFQNLNDFVQSMKQHRSTQLPARLEKKWKATSSTEPQNVQAEVLNQKGKTLGDKVLSYIATFDPTHGKHVYWLGITWLTNGLKLEDLEAARDDLQAFDEMTAAGQIEVDLEKVRTLPQLADLVRKPESSDDKQQVAVVDNDEAKMLAQSEVLWDDDQLRVIKPLTRAAACYFGRNTDWCTAWGSHIDLGLSKEGRYPSRTNQFQHYINQGPIYIIIIKPEIDDDGNIVKKGKRYQYHSETNQFANIKDKMLSRSRVQTLLTDYPEIKEAIGDALDDIEDMHAKHGMTPEVLQRISSSLASGLDIGIYNKEAKLFVVNTWTSFKSFLRSVANNDDDIEKILKIAEGESNIQDRDSVEVEFVKTALEIPPHWQEKLIARAGIAHEASERSIIDAAKKLISKGDEWFLIFDNLYDDVNELKKQAWDRLKEYAAVGWIFEGHGVYCTVPSGGDDFENFILNGTDVKLCVGESDMIGYAMAGDADYDEDDSHDDNYFYSIIKMRGDSGGSADWDALDEDYMREERRNAGLIVSVPSHYKQTDTWLKDISGAADAEAADDLLTDSFINALQGNTHSSKVYDPRQRELKFESLRRLMVLAGILRG